jgi:hypothetical protein
MTAHLLTGAASAALEPQTRTAPTGAGPTQPQAATHPVIRAALDGQTRTAPTPRREQPPEEEAQTEAAPAAEDDAAEEERVEAAPMEDTDPAAPRRERTGAINAVDALALAAEARSLGVEEHDARRIIGQAGATRESAGRALLAAASRAHRAQGRAPAGSSARAHGNERATFLQAASDGLMLRAQPSAASRLDERRVAAAREFRGLSYERLAMEVLARANISTRGLSRDALIRTALTTTDFPQLLTGTLRRTLRDAYDQQEVTFTRFARQVVATDFRPFASISLGGFGAFQEVPEGAPANYAAMSEEANTYRVRKFERLVGVTFEALVNDDLGAFNRLPQLLAAAAASAKAKPKTPPMT